MTTIRALATALADAFLASEGWRRTDLVGQGGLVLGIRRRWLWPVADSVLVAYPRPPTDRPRELAEFLSTLDPLRAAVATARQHQRPIVVRARPVTPTRTVRRPWHTPVIDTVGDLAAMLDLSIEHLDWYADRRGMNRRATAHRLHHYHHRWTDHGRLIEAPKSRLRALQRRLLAEVLDPIPVHPAAHGFVPGRSPHTFAAAHTAQPVVVRIDLLAFFTHIHATRVHGLFRTAGYPEPVAHTLTGLCTTRTPPPVLRRAPTDLPHRAARLAALRTGHLPQGAPTSPALANLCAYRLDRRLTGLADAFEVTYTRYADDLAFSGDLTTRQARGLIAAVTDIARDEGLPVHPAKTRVRGRADRQLLAGLVVNHHPATPRDEYDQLRAILHNAARTGLAAQNRTDHPDFAQHLIGRVTWVGHHHPARAAKLATLLAHALAAP
ncbi:reverse transcriptase family protein [Micromonospora sp. WMMD1076]|uniref:reverse transcriptase family protein n=1 Tax=Micromonospora sp. WMMD1076 TaxID=3016103 RepID=UPI00249C7079|nr:reverse transcriptase family protein [Micromonospora sp. WMMD1076]WFF08349.1 reverse transcriptase family protein [Micromonospora sp. WMMD1076]